jgi:1-deoxy-D-xylulose-5-phosphate synthase
MVVASPMNEEELRNMMYTSQLPREGAFTIRYPRGKGVMPEWRTPMQEIEVGKGRKLREGSDVAILTIGHIGNYAVEACEQLADQGIEAAHYDMRFVKPLDEEMLHEIFENHKYLITVEDGCLMGGFGSAVVEFMGDHGYSSTVKRLGIPDAIIEHGEQSELHKECGFDVEGIVRASQQILETSSKIY